MKLHHFVQCAKELLALLVETLRCMSSYTRPRSWTNSFMIVDRQEDKAEAVGIFCKNEREKVGKISKKVEMHHPL